MTGTTIGPDPADRARQVAVAALGLGLALLGLWTIHSFVPALLWALILAIATWRLHARLGAAGEDGRGVLLSVLFTATVALVVVAPLTLLAVQVGREASGLIRWIEEAQRTGLPPPDWIATLPFGREQAAAWWHDSLGSPEATAELLRRLQQAGALSLGRQLGLDLLHRATQFAFTILTLFFLYQHGVTLAAQALRAATRAFGPRGEPVLRQMVASVHGTVDGLVLVGLGEGVIMGVAYAIAGAPHPTLLGALTAVAAMIPFAAPLVFGFAALLLLGQGAVAGAAAVFGLGMVVLFVADHLVRPALIGGATRLPFLLVLLGILGGLETWGLVGLFLGPAIMACVVLLWREWVGNG